jgi:autotransporter-associated beta strand protein
VGTVLAGAGINFTGGTLTAGGADNVMGEIQYSIGAGSSTISSVIANNGTGIVSLVKTGAGTLVLSGANTNTGTTFVQQGTLEVLARSNWGIASGPGISRRKWRDPEIRC